MLCATGSVNQKQFAKMVKEVLLQNGSPMTSAEIDLLFRALDSNKCAAKLLYTNLRTSVTAGPCTRQAAKLTRPAYRVPSGHSGNIRSQNGIHCL